MSPIDGSGDINAAIHRINSEIMLPFIFENIHHQLKASIGSVLVPDDELEPDKLLELADMRMYAIKQLNKDS